MAIYPNQTVSSSTWTTYNATSDFHGILGDGKLSTWVESQANPVSNPLVLGMADFVPVVGADILLHVDVVNEGTGSLSSVNIEFAEGTSVRGTRLIPPRRRVEGESFRWPVQLTPEDIAKFTNWNNLQIRIVPFGGQCKIRVYGIEMEAGPVAQLQPGQWAYDLITDTLYVRLHNDLNPATQKLAIYDWRFGMEEVLLVDTGGSLIGRLCRHFSRVGDPSGADADAVRGASISYDSSRVVFSTNWGGAAPGIYAVLSDRGL